MLTPAWKNIFHTAHVPQHVSDWLKRTGSLTHALEAASGASCMVAVQQEDWVRVWPEEAQACPELLDSNWVREVVLTARQPAIFARTVFPRTLLEHAPALRQLGNTALGNVLFALPRCERLAIEVAEITAEHSLWQRAPKNFLPTTAWARRSVLQSSLGNFLINEVFLPYVFTL